MSEAVLGGRAKGLGGGSLSTTTYAVEGLGGSSDEEDSPISPEAMTEFLEGFYRKQYATLPDDAIPVLGDKSPRELLAERGGERLVAGFRAQRRGDGGEPGAGAG